MLPEHLNSPKQCKSWGDKQRSSHKSQRNRSGSIANSHIEFDNYNPPSELTFTSYWQEVNLFSETQIKKASIQQQKCRREDNQFTSEEREHLKNAFRYISRISFKQAKRYENKLLQFGRVSENIQKLFLEGEMISGEGYFRQLLQSLSKAEKIVVVEYMIWFLKTKYLRYIKDGEKGKRKDMKKDLYIRFKNQVMIPYLIVLLQNINKQ